MLQFFGIFCRLSDDAYRLLKLPSNLSRLSYLSSTVSWFNDSSLRRSVYRIHFLSLSISTNLTFMDFFCRKQLQESSFPPPQPPTLFQKPLLLLSALEHRTRTARLFLRKWKLATGCCSLDGVEMLLKLETMWVLELFSHTYDSMKWRLFCFLQEYHLFKDSDILAKIQEWKSLLWLALVYGIREDSVRHWRMSKTGVWSWWM